MMKKMFVINETRDDLCGYVTFPVRVVDNLSQVIPCMDNIIEDTIAMMSSREFVCVDSHAWYNLPDFSTAPHLGPNYRVMASLLFIGEDDEHSFFQFDGEEADVFEQ